MKKHCYYLGQRAESSGRQTSGDGYESEGVRYSTTDFILGTAVLFCLNHRVRVRISLPFLRHSWDLVCVTSSMFLRTGSLQTKLNAGFSEQQQEDLFQNERSFHEVKL